MKLEWRTGTDYSYQLRNVSLQVVEARNQHVFLALGQYQFAAGCGRSHCDKDSSVGTE